MAQDFPLVSCLLMAGSHPDFTARAIFCYQQQSWPSKELVIVGHEYRDIAPLLEDIPSQEICHISPSTEEKITEDKIKPGKLKNMGLDQAGGTYIIHWDEQDWHHPERIRKQTELMLEGYDACWLAGALLHLDHPEYAHHPRLDLPSGGYTRSLMHRNDPEIRFNEKKRVSEPAFFSQWKEKKSFQIASDHSWLIVRSVRGESKSAPYKRFLSGLRNSPKNFSQLAWLKLRGRQVVSHPQFKLSDQEKESFHLYLKESQKLGLITSIG